MLSPFRYPGGKTWLLPRIRDWLNSLPKHNALFVEPFAGGGAASLTVASECLAEHVIMVEMDDDVSAVWQVIFSDDVGWLIEQIKAYELTSINVEATLAQTEGTIRDRAFRAILKNRISRGGILAPGAGIISRGENGKGLASRWYPRTLCQRILAISEIRNRISFVHGDGLEVMRHYAANTDAAYFIDPPYTLNNSGKRPGQRLYTHNELDHQALFSATKTLSGDFLLTYNDNAEVRTLAQQHDMRVSEVTMRTTHHVQTTELIIGRNLGWMSLSRLTS